MQTRAIVLVLLILVLGPDAAVAGQNRIVDYEQALRLFWSQVYPRGGQTLYCGYRFGSRKGSKVNVEHVLPMAWVMNALGCEKRDQCRRDSERFNRIEADLHNLYPSLKVVNQARGSFPFAEVPGERWTFERCDFEMDARRRRVEPRPAARGEIARAMFYMHETYELEIRTRLGLLLKRWNRDDPPGPDERRRNEIIESVQGTRNRFIDDPQAADRLWF